jgi:Fe2+ transport system protein FeoA
MEAVMDIKTGIIPNEQASDTEAVVSEESKDINLLEAEIGRTYIVKKIDTEDDDMNAFLFRLGCYSGEPVTVVSKKKKSCIVVIKDGRYSIDNLIAESIIV